METVLYGRSRRYHENIENGVSSEPPAGSRGVECLQVQLSPLHWFHRQLELIWRSCLEPDSRNTFNTDWEQGWTSAITSTNSIRAQSTIWNCRSDYSLASEANR